jgi:hypothetical protein
MHRQMLLVIALILTASTAWGQAPSTPNEGESTKILLERIEQLEKRVIELEAKAGTTVGAPSTAPAVSPAQNPAPDDRMAGMERSQASNGVAQQASIQEAETHYPSLAIRGFADVDFSATDQKGPISGFNPGVSSGFNLGQFDLHLASPLSRKISYFGEITFTAQSTDPAKPTYAVEVERSIIRYDYDDYFKLSFGRYHTPISYWNTAFHHGTWLQTTITRPEMIKIGGIFIPVHFVGLLAEGNIPSGGLHLGYDVGVGNGRGQPLSRAGDAGDVNNNRALLVNLFARPAGLQGFQVGGSFYKDEITGLNGDNVREWIASTHIIWTKETPEFLAEFANSHNQDLMTGQVFNTPAFYVQIAYRLPWLERALKPYYRYDYVQPLPLELIPAGTVGTEYKGSTLGIRYDISNFAAFKSEYRNFRRQASEPRVNGAFFQTSFTF